jgi:preprotein translocase subunit SecY
MLALPGVFSKVQKTSPKFKVTAKSPTLTRICFYSSQKLLNSCPPTKQLIYYRKFVTHIEQLFLILIVLFLFAIFYSALNMLFPKTSTLKISEEKLFDTWLQVSENAMPQEWSN